MFRCSECGCEYETKPDFCDCGNDIFEEVLPCPEKEDAKPSFNMKPADIVSYLIFVVCIILSVLVLLFFPKITPTPQNNTHEQVLKPNTNIPDLSSIWIDSKPKQESIIDMIKDVVTAPPKEEKRAPHKAAPATVQQKQQAKPMQQTKTVQSPKPAQQAKPVKNNISTPTVGKPQTSSYSYEVVNYRTALRQRLLSNLDLYKIEGSGSCGIEFSINEDGKLINRNFYFQSDNKSVNDEVYKMLMRTPQFNPPPESYTNKKIRITLKLTSDSYEIKFAN